MKKVFAILLTLAALASLLAGCGSSSNESRSPAAAEAGYSGNSAKGAYDYAGTAEEPAAPYWDGSNTTSTAAGLSAGETTRREAKLIYTANMEMQTLDFEKATADIDALAAELGGYFEQRSLYQSGRGYRRADYTVRVPAERFDSFCNQVGELCHVVYSSSGAEDISDTYYDTESRLTTAKTKLERLQELLSQASDMQDIITIESAISDTEWQIDNLSGTMRNYDSLVGYSTVYLSLSEVYKLSGTEDAPVTFGQRLGNSFIGGLRAVGEFFEDLIMWLAYSWVWLLVIAAAAVVVVRAVKRRVVRRRAKKTSLAGEPPAENK